MLFRKNPEEKYKPSEQIEHFFKAYIVKGNRNIVSRDISASRRFKVEDGTYLIKPNCIRRKIIDGVLSSVSYYRENNPNPYDFKKENQGLSSEELDKTFAEDFYDIIIDLNPENRLFYFFTMVAANLGLCITFLLGVILKVYVFH